MVTDKNKANQKDSKRKKKALSLLYSPNFNPL